jgi:hypothetical protein
VDHLTPDEHSVTAPSFNIGQILNPGESIQRTQTGWSEDFTDQHGRRFQANYDNRNMRPKEELRPVDCTPPWQPPMKYIVWDRHNGFKFRWDYATMANDLTEAATSYYAQVFEFITEHMPGTEPPELGDPVPTKVLRSPIGKPPLSPAIPLACEAGDPWILGIPGAEPNKLLKDIIEQSATANGRQALQVIRERMQALAGDKAIPTIAPVKRSGRGAEEVHHGYRSDDHGQDLVSRLPRGRDGQRDVDGAGAAAWKAHRENLEIEDAPAVDSAA